MQVVMACIFFWMKYGATIILSSDTANGSRAVNHVISYREAATK